MRLPVFVIIPLCLFCVAAGRAEEERASAIGRLVEDLASDSYQEREKATEELWAAGEDALAPLRVAKASDDPEMSLRAEEVIKKIELNITPETPDEILVLIERYREAPQNQKANLLNDLKRKNAFFQVLKLYAMEEQPEVKAGLEPVIRGVAIAGAREAIVENDPEAAIRLLKMSASEPNDLMALACLYRSLGRIEAELDDPDPPANVPTDLWKITLLRAKGDIEGAALLAESAEYPRLLAGLKVLTGDPVLWIRQNGLNDSGRQAHPAYAMIAERRWSGGRIGGSDYDILLEALDERNTDEKNHAVSALASLGRLAELEKLQAKEDAAMGFEYYLSVEKIAEALTVMGLDPVKPDYSGWVADRFEELADDGDDNEASSLAMSRLLLIAGFLERRGLDDELENAFAEPMKRYSEENENHFLDFLASLFSGGTAPRYARYVAAVWAGEDENRWGEVFTVALGEEDVVLEWLSWIGEIEPGMKHAEKLDAMLAIFKVGLDPGKLRSKWMQRAWAAAESSPDKLRQEHVTRIMKLAASQQDVENALKAWDALELRKLSVWNSMDKYLSAAGRWKDAAEIMQETGKGAVSSSPELHAYLAATLRKAGLEGKAAEHDVWAEKLSLGYAQSCKRIGDCYSYGGDPARAALWYQRAAYQADSSANDFSISLDAYAGSMLQQEKWLVSASCYEALVQIYASRNFVQLPLSFFSKTRLKADLARGLSILPQDKKRAVSLLKGIHSNFVSDGVLADDFFPMVRKAGLTAELNEWFGESWRVISAVIDEYPESDNTRNTAAWFASRAGLELEDARKHLETALARNPDQPAYLDTMAEVFFASGDRKAAIKWSDRAMMFYPLTDNPYDLTIRQQNHRFRHSALPE